MARWGDAMGAIFADNASIAPRDRVQRIARRDDASNRVFALTLYVILSRDLAASRLVGTRRYSVSVLKVGYCLPQTDGTFRADGTITLITGPRIILVDTGGPWDRDFLLMTLKERGLAPGDINLVVGTHGHSDHVGNLSLFPTALTIVGYDISEGDTYRPNKLAEGHAYSVDEHISVLPSPGHTGQDVSVQVKGTSAGTVLVAGDLFECCSDEDSWRDLSMNAAVQEVSRQQALRTADVIIPGHGLPFRILRNG